MLLETLTFLAFASMLGCLVWWTWMERQAARITADTNAVRAKSAEDRALEHATQAELGRSLDAVAHDLNNLLMTMAINVQEEDRSSDEEAVHLRRTSLKNAIISARTLIAAVRKRARGVGPRDGSIEGIVRLTVALVRSQGVKVRLTAEGDVRYHGSDLDALHVVHNLMSNAADAARRVENGYVHVELSENTLRITNPVRDSAEAADRVSAQTDTRAAPGGLDLARSAASSLGWTLGHDLDGDEMTTYIDAARKARAGRRTASGAVDR